MKKSITFVNFCELYGGEPNIKDNLQIIKDSLINIKNGEEITWDEIMKLIVTNECKIEQNLITFNGFYELIINDKYACDSTSKII